MADDRTTTIINEIKYWKQNKLLPETYCDYLLALYTKGNYSDEEILEKRKPKRRFFFVIQVFLLILMIPFSLLVIYFTQFNTILQLSILLLFIGYTFWIFMFQSKQKSSFIHLPLNVLLLLFLILTLFISSTIVTDKWIVITILLGNFSLWPLFGKKLRVNYVAVLGVVGIIITLFYNFSHLFPLN